MRLRYLPKRYSYLVWFRGSFSQVFTLSCRQFSYLVAALIFCCSTFAATGTKLAKGTNLNVLVVLADDLGYTDLGYMGGEIATPHIDSLASHGLVFTNFYSAPVCTPTRAQLMTGVDNNLAGSGKAVNYSLKPNVATIAEVLKETNYESILVGKWDLGWREGLLPIDRGFDKSYAVLPGAIEHFQALHRRSEQQGIGPVVEGHDTVKVKDDFYTTVSFTDKLIEYIGERTVDDPPFFALASYMAPHWPLGAPEADIQKYEQTYSVGYSAIRDRRITRIKSLFSEYNWSSLPKPNLTASWHALTETGRKEDARRMAAYAAMTSIMDREIGRLIEHLDRTGILQDTVILFLSDNGADAMTEESAPFLLPNISRDEVDNSLANIGRPGSYSTYGPNWAQVSSGPLNGVKETAMEGGIAVPALMVVPGTNPGGRSTDAIVGVRDITATIYELADVSKDRLNSLSPALEGKSLLPLLSGAANIRSEGEPLIIYNVERYTGESVGAIRKDNWKLVRDHHNEWMLFDLANDRGETHDVLREKPDVFCALWRDWLSYSKRIDIAAGDQPAALKSVAPCSLNPG